MKWTPFQVSAVVSIVVGAGHPVSAGQPPSPPCSAAAMAAADEIERNVPAWRAQTFDAFRHRLVNADLSTAAVASDPVVITGSLSDDKTTAKVQGSVAFKGGGTASVLGSLSSANATSIDLTDPLHAATKYSAKFTIGWSHWDNVLPKRSVIDAAVCEADRQRATPAGETATVRTAALVAAQRARIVVRTPIVASASVEVGQSTFSFADPGNDYQKASEDHAVHAVSATGGYVLTYSAKGNSPITTLLFTYQRRWAYADGSDTTKFVCHPIPGSTASDCDTNALPEAAPISKPSHVIEADVRHFLDWPIAPGLRFTRNLTTKVDTTEAPIYFISKGEKDTDRFSFTGGVTVGYRDGGSSKGRFVALFFGTTARPTQKQAGS